MNHVKILFCISSELDSNYGFELSTFSFLGKRGPTDPDCFLSDPPNVSIQLGKSLIATEIHQGIDVYFDCIVNANPIPKSKIVTWLHNVSPFFVSLAS